MTIRDRLQGILPPVVTTFDEAGDVSTERFRANLLRWIETPIDGIVLFGSNGEGALLDEDEKEQLTALSREVVPAGLVLVAGTSGESTRATIRQARQLAAAGAEVLLVHPPGYFGPHVSAAALMDHFRAVADASPVPVLLYHIPKFTNVTLDPGFVGELMRHPNVVGLKDSAGDMKRFADYSTVCDGECRLFIGNGALLYAALELGAAGGILGVANIAPGLCADVVRHHREGRTQEAGRVQELLSPLHRRIVAAHGGAGCKAALDLMGWNGGAPRAPLQALSERERTDVARVMQESGLTQAAPS